MQVKAAREVEDWELVDVSVTEANANLNGNIESDESKSDLLLCEITTVNSAASRSVDEEVQEEMEDGTQQLATSSDEIHEKVSGTLEKQELQCEGVDAATVTTVEQTDVMPDSVPHDSKKEDPFSDVPGFFDEKVYNMCSSFYEACNEEEDEDEWGLVGVLLAEFRKRVESALAAMLHFATSGVSAAFSQKAMMAAMETARAASYKVFSTLRFNSHNGVAMLSLGLLAGLALTGLTAQVSRHKHLTIQVRQRDDELARLFTRMLRLQDTLSSNNSILLRHTAFDGSFAASHL